MGFSPKRIRRRFERATRDWNRLIDDVLQSGDGQGHGPDLGSAEWQSVIEFRLGVRDDPELPDAGSDAWCTEIDSRVRAR